MVATDITWMLALLLILLGLFGLFALGIYLMDQK